MLPSSKTVLALAGVLACFTCYAQNNTSPYSILGIGDIESSYHNKYTGIGNAAVAMSDGASVNNSNAASLTKLNDNFFIMELSTRWKGII
jgi:hypothetical protein